MKKLLLSVSSILLSGVVLASCSNGFTYIKAPKKGKPVDRINVQIGENTTLSFDKDDTFEEVIDKIDDYYTSFKMYVNKDKKSSFESIEKESSNIKERNHIEDSTTIYDKYDILNSYEEYADIYRNCIKEEADSYEYEYYINSKSKLNTKQTRDKFSVINKGNNNSESYTHPKYDEDDNKYSLIYSSYNSSNNTETYKYENEKETNKEKNSLYKYIDKSGDIDDTFNNIYKGYDSIGKLYSYRPSQYFEEMYHSYISLTNIYDNSEIYNDFRDLKIELTDSEIILKGKLNYSYDAIEYVNFMMGYDNQNGDAAFEEYLEAAMDNEYKGSYKEFELWLRYDEKLDDYNTLTYSYYSVKSEDYYDIKEELSMELLSYVGLDKEYMNDYYGKTYTKKGSTKYSFIEKYNDKFDYSKKINNLNKKCKKNNIFDKIEMKEELSQ